MPTCSAFFGKIHGVGSSRFFSRIPATNINRTVFYGEIHEGVDNKICVYWVSYFSSVLALFTVLLEFILAMILLFTGDSPNLLCRFYQSSSKSFYWCQLSDIITSFLALITWIWMAVLWDSSNLISLKSLITSFPWFLEWAIINDHNQPILFAVLLPISSLSQSSESLG